MSPSAPAEDDRRFAWLSPRAGGAVSGGDVATGRVMRWLRLGLPVLALLVLGFLVAWPQIDARLDRFDLSDLQTAFSDKRVRMTNVVYAGRDDRNRPFTIHAATATQTRPEPREVALTEIEAELKLARGWVIARAATGTYVEGERKLHLAGALEVHGSDGFELRGEEATFDLRQGLLLSDRKVEGQGPLGFISGNAAAVGERGRHIHLYRGVTATLYPPGEGS